MFPTGYDVLAVRTEGNAGCRKRNRQHSRRIRSTSPSRQIKKDPNDLSPTPSLLEPRNAAAEQRQRCQQHQQRRLIQPTRQPLTYRLLHAAGESIDDQRQRRQHSPADPLQPSPDGPRRWWLQRVLPLAALPVPCFLYQQNRPEEGKVAPLACNPVNAGETALQITARRSVAQAGVSHDPRRSRPSLAPTTTIPPPPLTPL